MPHATATVHDVLVAETDSYEVVDGNIYFPPSAIKTSYFTPTATHTHCPYKGDASYYTININGKEIADAAWYYPQPKPGMEKIRDHVAFYKSKSGIKVQGEQH